jgi:hypothetical protein
MLSYIMTTVFNIVMDFLLLFKCGGIFSPRCCWVGLFQNSKLPYIANHLPCSIMILTSNKKTPQSFKTFNYASDDSIPPFIAYLSPLFGRSLFCYWFIIPFEKSKFFIIFTSLFHTWRIGALKSRLKTNWMWGPIWRKLDLRISLIN